MGLWTKLFGGAEGCREAMRESYKMHVRAARKNGTVASSPHLAGLYGALATRYTARGTPVAEVIVWAQLAPFLVMKEVEAVEALAEYVVFQERPRETRVAWLKEAINSALCSCSDPSRTIMAAGGVINRAEWSVWLEPDTLKVIDDAVEKMQQDAESESTPKKNEKASVRAMGRGKSTEVLRPGLKEKARREETQYCFQPDGEDVPLICRREDILADGPPPVRRPQAARKEEAQKRTITAEQMGIVLSEVTFRSTKDLFQEFEDTGFMAQLSGQQKVRLGLDLLLFELVCKTLSLAQFYGEEGYKASSFLVRETITAFAKNLQIENVSSFTDAAFAQFNSHYQYYSQDIWELWSAMALGDKEVYDQKSGLAGIGGLGEKILRKILNRVIGISLEKPKIDREVGQDLGDACKEWGNIPLLKLTLILFIHVTECRSILEGLAKEFIISNSEAPDEES